MTEMTPKQKAFCDYYLISFNATESAKKAGYSEKTARSIGVENLTKPVIKAYLAERMQKLDNNRIASIEEVLEKITSVMRNDLSKNFEILKACELLGKRYGLWLDNQVNHEKTVVNIINDIPSKEK